MTKNTEVSGNISMVVWPQDKYQLTQGTKREGLKAVRRVGHNKAKLVTLLSTLDMLKEHAKARYIKETHVHERIRTDAVERGAREAENEAQRSLQRIKAHEAELERMKTAHGSLAPVVAPVSQDEALRALRARGSVDLYESIQAKLRALPPVAPVVSTEEDEEEST